MRQIVAFLLCAGFLTACKKVAEAPPVNTPPKTVAGPDVTIRLPVDSILLDGSRSTGQNGGALNFSWTKLDGPAGDIIVSPNAKSTYVRHLSAGVYHYRLEVCENNLCSGDTVRVTVTQNNKSLDSLPPIAKAGNDTTVAVGASVKLDGSKSNDPDGKIVLYNWRTIDGNTLNFNITDANMPVATVQILGVGIFHFELWVQDSSGKTARDTVTIHAYSNDSGLSWIPITDIPGGGTIYSRLVAAAGNKLIVEFSHHYESNLEIYDLDAGTWVGAIGNGGINMGITVQGSKVYFLGGETYVGDTITSKKISIYDASSGQWTGGLMPISYAVENAHSTGNFVFIGSSTRIDILNTSNNSWSFQMPGWNSMLGFDNKIYGYAGGNNVYDLITNQLAGVSIPSSLDPNGNYAVSATTNNMAFFLDTKKAIYALKKGESQWNELHVPRGTAGTSMSAISHEVYFWTYTDSASYTNVFNEITGQWKYFKTEHFGAVSHNDEIYASDGRTIYRLNH